MRFLTAILLLLATSANAQVASLTTYIGNRIPNNTSGQISPTGLREAVTSIVNNFSSIPYAGLVNTANSITTSGYVSASIYYGSGGSLTDITADSVSGSLVIDVRDPPYNVICDGAAHSGNLAGAQAALDSARTASGTTVWLAPPNVTCVYGTNTTLNAEAPLKYVSNTDIVLAGGFVHNINNNDLFGLQGLYDDIADTQRQQNVRIIGLPGNWVDTVSRTTSQQRKMIGMTNVINSSIQGVVISTTTNSGNFAIQLRNATNVTTEGNYVALFPNPSGAAGGDAFHITGASSHNTTVSNAFYGDDDACSITQEGAASAGLLQRANIFRGNVCSTYRNSGGKMFSDALSVGASTPDTVWDSNYFGVWGPQATGGNAITFYTEGNGGTFENTQFVNNIYDCTNSPKNTGSGAGACILMQNDNPNIKNTTFSGGYVTGYPYRGFNLQANITGVNFNGVNFTNYSGEFNIVTTTLVTSMTYSTADFMRVDVPSATLTSVTASAQYYISTTAGLNASNTGHFLITAVSTTGGFVTVASNGVSSSSNQTGLTASASIIFRPGSSYYFAGAKDIVVKNSQVEGGPAVVIMEGTGTKPRNVTLMNNQVNNFTDWSAYQVTSGWNTFAQNNTCLNATGNSCIRESSSANVSQSIFIMNADIGNLSRSRQSFIFGDADYLYKWGNVGTNADYFNTYAFGTVSASLVSATTLRGDGSQITGITGTATPTWGSIQGIPANVQALSTTTSISFSTASSTQVALKNLQEYVVSSSITTSYTIDLTSSSLFRLTPTNSSTLTFTGAPNTPSLAKTFTVMIVQGGSGSNTITWPGTVKWSGAASPTLSTSVTAVDTLQFMSLDLGATWQGYLSGVDMR